VLAVIIALIAELLVAAMSESVAFIHQILFGLDPGERLSGRVAIDPLRALLVPV
jgi:chloride channel protein, CIC family